MPTHIERLETAAGKTAAFLPSKQLGDAPSVSLAYWNGIPESGFLTGSTLGLSASQRWKAGTEAPELIISIKSERLEWMFAALEVAVQGIAKLSFNLGDYIDFGSAIAPDTAMSAFLVVPQMVLPEEYDIIKSERGPIVLRQLVPIYSAELRVIRAQGAGLFIKAEPDVSDPRRPKILPAE
jgi:hypothetical protein